MRSALSVAAIGLWCCAGLAKVEDGPPPCRLDNVAATQVETTLLSATKTYSHTGTSLPFSKVVINPRTPPSTPGTLAVFVVSDASVNEVDQDGCLRGSKAFLPTEELDKVSVRGGCVAGGSDKLEIRCSSAAVQIFGAGNNRGSANPALLYVLAHELGHILQRRPGEYAGRVEPINLRAPREVKLQVLRDSCEPDSPKLEEEADRRAIQVLSTLLPVAPYREPLFSEKGSVLWGADQINLAANTWRKQTLAREFASQPEPHKSFVPTEFPTPSAKIEANAKRFVCDVLTKKSGTVFYPGKAITHPPLELRMQKVAEALRTVAAGLPKTGAQQEYRSVSTLQEQVSDIFTAMYRETGVYLEAIQGAICTQVNSEKPTDGCR